MMLERACTGGLDRPTVAVHQVSLTPRTEPTGDLSVADTMFGRCVKAKHGRAARPALAIAGVRHVPMLYTLRIVWTEPRNRESAAV
jgi:hypothetical protein